MPLALEPNETFPIALDSDSGKPPESQPVFLCRYLSMRDARRARRDYDSLFDQLATKTVDELYDQTLDQLCEYIIGWKNMPTDCAFGREGLEAVLTEREAWQLLRKVQENQATNVEEKKS